MSGTVFFKTQSSAVLPYKIPRLFSALAKIADVCSLRPLPV